jgi:hypothetical protein
MRELDLDNVLAAFITWATVKFINPSTSKKET